MQENTLPWVIKLVPAVVGAILALVLSGDIDKEGKIQVTLGLIGKFLFSVSVSLYGGAAFIEYYELNQYSHMAQGFVMLIFAVFGLLTIGIVYQSIALMQGKSIAEVITEVKAAFVAIIGGGKMKLIDNWKQAWKLKSVQVGALSAFLLPKFRGHRV